MPPGAGRIANGFRFRELALRAFESVFLRAVGARLPACQLHSCSTHRAARRLDRLGGRRCELVRRGMVSPHDRDLRLTPRTGKACCRSRGQFVEVCSFQRMFRAMLWSISSYFFEASLKVCPVGESSSRRSPCRVRLRKALEPGSAIRGICSVRSEMRSSCAPVVGSCQLFSPDSVLKTVIAVTAARATARLDGFVKMIRF